MSQKSELRWAPKVSQAKIWRLYQTDARGLVDEELIDEVGTALYARCRSVLLVSKAQLECPRCHTILTLGWGHPEQDVVSCPFLAVAGRRLTASTTLAGDIGT